MIPASDSIPNIIGWWELYPLIMRFLLFGSICFWFGVFSGRTKLVWAPIVMFSLAAIFEVLIFLPITYFLGELRPHFIDIGFVVCSGITTVLVTITISKPTQSNNS